MPEHFIVNDNMIEPPASPEDADKVEVLRGPNIKPFPKTEKLPEEITAKAVLKVGDNITTDHIMPAGAKILPYRSNIPHLSQYCFAVCDETFPERIKAEGKGFIIGGANYGQGSSREHAALFLFILVLRLLLQSHSQEFMLQTLLTQAFCHSPLLMKKIMIRLTKWTSFHFQTLKMQLKTTSLLYLKTLQRVKNISLILLTFQADKELCLFAADFLITLEK